jgi:hypothetical protein
MAARTVNPRGEPEMSCLQVLAFGLALLFAIGMAKYDYSWHWYAVPLTLFISGVVLSYQTRMEAKRRTKTFDAYRNQNLDDGYPAIRLSD